MGRWDHGKVPWEGTLPKVDVPRPPPPTYVGGQRPHVRWGGGTYVRAERPNVRWGGGTYVGLNVPTSTWSTT